MEKIKNRPVNRNRFASARCASVDVQPGFAKTSTKVRKDIDCIANYWRLLTSFFTYLFTKVSVWKFIEEQEIENPAVQKQSHLH